MSARRKQLSRQQKPQSRPIFPVAPREPQGSVIIHHKSETLSAHSGPLPHPDILREYDAVVPGLATQIVTMMRMEGEHRRSREKDLLDAQIADAQQAREQIKRGQRFGLITCLTAIVVGGIVAIAGHPIPGSVIGGGGLAGIITAFLVPQFKNSSQKTNEQPSGDLAKKPKEAVP